MSPTEALGKELTELILQDDIPGVLTRLDGHIRTNFGYSKFSRLTGMNRRCLYRIISPDSDPKISNLSKVLRALGVEIRFS